MSETDIFREKKGFAIWHFAGKKQPFCKISILSSEFDFALCVSALAHKFNRKIIQDKNMQKKFQIA
jgi:hypothetical protein